MKKISLALLSPLLLLVLPKAVHAAEVTIVVNKPNNLIATDIGQIITGLVSVILVVAGLAAFMYLILGGLTWITSGGDKSKIESAQHRIQAAIVGLFIVFASWAIMMLIEQFLGISILHNLKFQTIGG